MKQSRLQTCRRISLALVAALAACCHRPVDWQALDEQTLEQNLAALQTAEEAYLSRLSTGDISAAAREAQARLQGLTGVDTVIIAPDSTVWAYFANGLVAGVCEQTFGTGTSTPQPPLRGTWTASAAPEGGVVGSSPEILVPFAEELPGTVHEAEAVLRMCRNCYVLRKAKVHQNNEVTVTRVKALLQDARSLLFWTGHGCLVSPYPGAPPGAALLTGKGYSRRELAAAVAGDFRADAQAGQSGPRLAFVAHNRRFYPVILPAFVRAYGRFENSEPYWKTIVYVSACFSAYVTNPELEQAFRDAGADLYCGFDWAVNDMFSCELDTTFLGAMADTCLPLEALAQLGAVTDPDPIFGRNASFRISGDTLAMLRHVLDARRDGRLHRAGAVVATSGGQTNLQGAVVPEGDSEPVGQITVMCPGAPGSYDLQVCDDAAVFFIDERESRVYSAVKGYVGTGGSIEISRWSSDLISGSFSGVLGYWAPGLIPTRDQPTAVITLTGGHIKHTGWRVGSTGATRPAGPDARIMRGTPDVGWSETTGKGTRCE